jgi:hypothetical protein
MMLVALWLAALAFLPAQAAAATGAKAGAA